MIWSSLIWINSVLFSSYLYLYLLNYLHLSSFVLSIWIFCLSFLTLRKLGCVTAYQIVRSAKTNETATKPAMLKRNFLVWNWPNPSPQKWGPTSSTSLSIQWELRGKIASARNTFVTARNTVRVVKVNTNQTTCLVVHTILSFPSIYIIISFLPFVVVWKSQELDR